MHHNIKVIPVPVVYSRKQLLISLSFYLMLPLFSWRHFFTQRPEIIYTRASFLDVITIAPLRLFFKFTYVAEVNGTRSLETKGNIVKRHLVARLERLSMLLADKAICVTPALRQWAIEIGNLKPEQTVTISNGVNVKQFYHIPSSRARAILGLDPNVRYLTFTCSLKPWHGTRFLIESLACILSEYSSGIRLLLVGDGPEKVRMVKLARRLGVNHIIDWIGQVSSSKVPLYINSGEICLAPFSLGRNVQTGISPIKIFEYMACSRPFITTRVEPTYDNLIESCHCGVLVPPNDTTALADSVLKLLQNPKQCARMGQQGRRIAVERYSWAKIAEQIEQFITQPQLPPNKQNF